MQAGRKQSRRRISIIPPCVPVQLLKKFGDQVRVDIIDRLPTPLWACALRCGS